MDDIRRPYHPQRGNYAAGSSPTHRPPDRKQPHEPDNSPSQTHHLPVSHPHHPPANHQTHNSPHIRVAPHPHTPAQPSHQYQSVYHRPPVEHPVHTQPDSPKTKHRLRLKLFTALACLGVAGLLVAAGYAFKSSEDSKTLPAQVTNQADYAVYFPSPMPEGYAYMKDTATFQIGQVFYKFSNGSKRVTVKEEPVPNPAPDLSVLAGYKQFNAPIGKAAVGTTAFGQPSAVVVTSSTVITLNGTGGVTTEELRSAVMNLKNIGQSSERKT